MPRKPTTNGAPAVDTVTPISKTVWEMLTKYAAARQTAVNRLETAVTQRDDLDKELNQLGPGDSEEHLQTSRRLVKALRSIRWYRKRIRALADAINDLLLEPTQDRHWDAMPDPYAHDPDEASLFAVGKAHFSDGAQSDEGGHGPVGVIGEPEEEPGPAVLDQADTLEAYVPGVFKNQNGKEVQVRDIHQLGNIAKLHGEDADIVPSFSPSWGCRVDFKRGKETLGCLAYVGPIPGKSKSGRKPKA